MPEILTPVVTKVAPANTIDSLGQIVRQVQVTVVVGTHGPFNVVIPTDQFTAAKAKEEMQKVADQINQLIR